MSIWHWKNRIICKYPVVSFVTYAISQLNWMHDDRYILNLIWFIGLDWIGLKTGDVLQRT